MRPRGIPFHIEDMDIIESLRENKRKREMERKGDRMGTGEKDRKWER